MSRPDPDHASGPAPGPAPWVLSDGAAGNERQALALAEALSPLAPRVWRLAARAPQRWLSPRRLPGAEAAFGPDFAAALATPPALAIGCGRQAALATRLLRARGARVVQILDPRIDPAHWDLVVAPLHDRLAGANVLGTLGSLHPVGPAWLAQARADFAAFEALPSPRIGLLLGGPIKAAPLDPAWWEAVAARVEALLAGGGSLLLSGSRRTPAWLAEAARARFAARPGLRWFGQDDGPNPYAGLLAWSDRLLVSPDSINLVSEACATTVPVAVHAPWPMRGRHGAFLASLRGLGRIQGLDDAPPPTVAPLRVLPELAAEVRRRLGLPATA